MTEKMIGMMGIYFLIKDNAVVYIGQSKNMKQRIDNHGPSKYDSFRMIECEKSKLNHYETRWIRKFKPKSNKLDYGHHNPDSESGRKPIYTPETLKIGQKMELSGKAKRFKHQYLRNFNRRGEAKFELEDDNRKVFVKRVA